MDMSVDQPGQDGSAGEIDQARARGRRREPRRDGGDSAVDDGNSRGAQSRARGIDDEVAGVDDQSVGRGGGRHEQAKKGEEAREHGRIPRKGGRFHATAGAALTSEKPGAVSRPGLFFLATGTYQKKS